VTTLRGDVEVVATGPDIVAAVHDSHDEGDP
jgi:hypothetical protein